MKKFNKTILDQIGNTPIVKLNHVANNVKSEIYVKLEFLNPGGSIKDRMGKYMCEQAVKRGDLKPGGTIIEATSGNTGVGIALFAAIHNYNAVFIMADKQSKEKIDALKAFGAKVIICPTDVAPEDPRSYYSVAKKLSEELDNCFYANQYHNEDNTQAHFHSTGPEIFEQTEGDFDVFITGVGTGGTISGTGSYLKSKMPKLQVVGVDIEGSILAHFHKTGEIIEAKPYVLEGLGEDFIPSNINFDVIDDFVVVYDEESFQMTREILKHEGLYIGGSSGAAVQGAIRYAEKLKEPKRILVILPDSGSRYLSKIYNNSWMQSHNYQLPDSHPELTKKVESIFKGLDVIIS